MRVGDKYICIKNIPEYFTKGKIYSISYIESSNFFITGDNGYDMSFYIHRPKANTYVSYDHFIKLNEMRKSKLKKLNERR